MRNEFNYIAITNNIKNAQVLSNCGVDQIMVDLEVIGKAERQKDRDTVMSSHSLFDVQLLKSLNLKSKLICRVNPFHDMSSDEINSAINFGADYIMIPMIESLSEYKEMVNIISNRCRVIPLIETPYSVFKIEEIINCCEIVQIHFGLNDLSISLNMDDLFDIIFSKTFQSVVSKVKKQVKIVGIGGIASPLFTHRVDPRLLVKFYKSIGGNSVILSRSFFKENYLETDILKGLGILENSLRFQISESELAILKNQTYNRN